MGLLQKKPQTISVPLYRIGTNKTLLIIGLGNPGKEYENTRHNIGFECLDNFAKKLDFPKWSNKKDLKCLITQNNVGESRIILIKPTTFMNLSGQAAQAVASFYKIPDNKIIAVYDELAIPFGQIRTRAGGSSAGHNGVKSLIEHLGENFGRVRIGIANKHSDKTDNSDFVLAKFNKEETAEIPNMLQELNSLLSEFAYSGQPPTETRSFIL